MSSPTISTPGLPGETSTTSSSSSTTTTSSSTTTSTTSTTTTPPPTSTTSTTSTTSSTTSTPTTSTTTTSTTSTTTTSTSSTTVVTPPPTTSTRITTTSGTPVVITSTSVVTSSGTALPSASASSTAEKGFFQKTGAVAGTFTAVGVVGLIILIVLISTGIRRRRAKKFDQEIAEAAREAAATQPPVFLDDDDDDYRSGPYGSTTYGTKGGPYSDVSSHGTYNQPAMVPPESFGMREMPPGSHGPAPGEVFDYGAAAAGAAGIGVARARSQNNGASYGQGLQEGGAPYAAFNMPPGPTGSPPPPQYHYNKSSSGAHGLEVLEAAGMGAHVAGAGAALARGPSQYQAQGDGYQQDGLTRKKSLVSHEGEIVYPTSASTAGQAYYSASGDPYAGFNAPQQQQGAYGGYEEEDAYGGYVVSEDAPARTSPGVPMPSPYDAARHPEGVDDGYARHGEDAYDSADEEDEPKRVLKVANE